MRQKLDVGDTVGEALGLYGKSAGVLLPLAFWLFLAVAVVEGLAGEDLALIALSGVLGLFLGTLYEGMVVGHVQDIRDGRRDSSMGGLVRMVLPVLPTLLVAGLLYMLGAFVGFLLLVVPGLYLLTIWALVAPAVVIERRGVFDAFGRSRQLVRGNGWRVFGVVIIAGAITLFGTAVLTSIAEGIADGPLVRIVFSALASTVIAPISGLIVAVLYFRLRAIEGELPSAEGPGALDPAAPPPA